MTDEEMPPAPHDWFAWYTVHGGGVLTMFAGGRTADGAHLRPRDPPLRPRDGCDGDSRRELGTLLGLVFAAMFIGDAVEHAP